MMSLAYKVEELLALRDSVSESAVSIEKFADEDVIKEHVLRPSASASANLVCRESSRSLRPSVAAGTAQAGPLKKPSPSPSFKRGKAERLLKEHGSPPGLRVTAGGRIVPSDLPPLSTFQYGDTPYRSQTLRAASSSTMPTNHRSNGNGTARIEVIGGQPVVFVGDRMFALPAVNTTNSTTTTSAVTPAMEPFTKPLSESDHLSAHGTLPAVAFGPSRASSRSPFAGLDLPTLKAQQTLRKQELRTVEQTEVLQASQQTEAWRACMIEKKRCLIVELDSLRKQITSLEGDNHPDAQSGAPVTGAVSTGTAQIQTFAPQFGSSHPQNLYGFPPANPFASIMMYQPPAFSSFPSFPTAEPAPFVSASVPNPPHSPGSASRRSHAIEIKPPREGTTKHQVSALDPKSPTYEPALKSTAAQNDAIARTPSPPKKSPWRLGEVPERAQHTRRDASQKLSLSSIDTTDFFPTNTHEHSSTRMAPQVISASSKENAVPSTPDKHWPASPWNEGNSGRSRNEESASKLKSWPEAFAKQTSFSTLRNSTGSHPESAPQTRAPLLGSILPGSASSNNLLPRAKSDQRTGTEDNWTFSSKAVAHVPSTYQEGYQAGYDHIGTPDDPEVLQGYIQGLLHFLSDDAKKRGLELSARSAYMQSTESRTPSLRGLVADSTPHDSAISMTFNRDTMTNNRQENVRSANGNVGTSIRTETAYGAHVGAREDSASHTLRNELKHDRGQHVGSVAGYTNSVGLFLEKNVQDQQHQNAAVTCENRLTGGNQEISLILRNMAVSKGGVSQQKFGNQLQNRDYMTPLVQQRFYPNPKDMNSNGFRGDKAASARPLAHQRFSGLDGAMDDLSEMAQEAHVDDRFNPVDLRPTRDGSPTETEEANTSCFRPSGSKGKQKFTSPHVRGIESARDKVASPIITVPGSPKKPGEISPAKAKLEQVTNKFRRGKKDDPQAMSPDDKMRRSEKWRLRFQQLKKTELEEIEKYRDDNHT